MGTSCFLHLVTLNETCNAFFHIPKLAHLPSDRNTWIQVVQLRGAQGNFLVLLSVCCLHFKLQQLLLQSLYLFLFLARSNPVQRSQIKSQIPPKTNCSRNLYLAAADPVFLASFLASLKDFSASAIAAFLSSIFFCKFSIDFAKVFGTER